MSPLSKLNGFIKDDNGVFRDINDDRRFDYSDGESSEQYLADVLTKASDLSSNSSELQSYIVDWPTEYHLSNTRANLLRSLDLSWVKRVLELGCGCGSITRYLGERADIEVDAVEGSPIRAALARQRCRDLENVTISAANFNEVALPEGYYDLVLYIGVTEYAGRFSDKNTDQEALQDLLKLAKHATNDTGITAIAIENRLGAKYLLGANEDHYGVPFVGVDNYPDSTGIRTYSQAEWVAQISSAGFSACRFLYPFPDYKIPTLIASDDASGDEFLSTLKLVESRDYIADFTIKNEGRLWEGLYQAGSLGEHANSFLLIVGDSQTTVDKTAEIDFKSFDVVDVEQYTMSTQSNSEHATDIENINEVCEETAQLEQQPDSIKGSPGRRLLNYLRVLFGKPAL